MKYPAFALAMLSLSLALAAQAMTQPEPRGAEVVASRFFALFIAKDPAFASLMNDRMRAAFGAPQAGAAVDQLAAKGGGFQGFEAVKVTPTDGMDVVTLTGTYERMLVDFSVTIDQEGRVAGFYVVKIRSRVPWTLPPYAKAGSWTDEELSVGAEGWPLPGTLSLPRGSGPFPALVLVHGSGPNDRDESIGPNKVFADIAAGLASRGIAVLRYDKRTFVFKDKIVSRLAEFGVKDETVDDAVAALALLAKDPRIDGRRIFIVGHSLGAMLGPMIASEAEARGLRVAGLVLLAPNARPLEDVIVDQIRYLAKIEAPGKVEAASQVAAIEAAAARVKTLAAKASPADPSPELLPLGIGAYWWRSLQAYEPVAAARALGLPLLVIHGSRDYQVMASEAALWKTGLKGLSKARPMVIKGLNHLMMKGSGIATPAEYEEPGHVDRAVIDAMAAFLIGGR
ncbi:MAG TPA: alpha/beta fold hydrolase [Rectinemataceae bacterium]|nr:alpha/beta fold hydrolase [Rectinemataceae bacterium]